MLILKSVYIVLSKLKSMVKNNIFIFSMFFIGIFFSNLMFTYFYGNIRYAAIKYNAPSFEIQNIGGGSIDVAALDKELSDCKSVYYFSVIDKNSIRQNTNEHFKTDEYLKTTEDAVIYIATCRNMDNFYVKQGRIKNLAAENSIIIPDGILKKGEEFPDIFINGKTYKTVGVTGSQFFLVSQENYIKNNLPTFRIDINLSPNTTDEERIAFMNKLNTLFDKNFTINDKTLRNINSEITEEVIFATIVYFISIFALLFLMADLFEQSAYELSVYELLGATRFRIIFILSALQFVILVIVGLFSQLVHHLLYGVLFSKINVYEFTYSFEMYAQSLFITVVSVLLFVVLYLCVKMKRYAIVNCRKFIT